MSQENENTKITENDISFLERELSLAKKPLFIQEMTKKLVYQKASGQLTQEVKKYDPECQYEVGDLIYKEYDEPLMVSSKGIEPFKGAVVLKVVRKIPYKNYNCDMLEVDYSGGGLFRKYIDYMKKTKTQVLLPSNLEGKSRNPEIMEKQEDPRLSELPMTDRDFKTFEKNTRAFLSKLPRFFNWNEYWQLTEKKIEIQEEKVREIENYIAEKRSSVSTPDLVNKFFNKESSDELFDLFCMSLNFTLEKKFKKDFVNVSPLNWGKWHLKKILNFFPLDLPLSALKARLPAFLEGEKEEAAQKQDFPLKFYLSWREILSGGVKIPKNLNKKFSESREYIFNDTEEGKEYSVYYYPSSGIFLGLKDFYEMNNVPQGASLALERISPTLFNFWLKKSKKKLSGMKMTYDPKEDKFALGGEDVFTFSLPNKIIHLERETLTKLFFYYQQRDDLDLRELLTLIFKNFGLESENFSLHYLRAYHLVDILRLTTQEEVEKTLLSSPEFISSEKKKGIFFYQEKVRIEEEARPEELEEILPEAPAEEAPPSAQAFEETPSPEFEVEIEGVRAEAPSEILRAGIEKKEKREKPRISKKEKLPRKKRQIIEGEKDIRARKGVKKFIEEKIEIEESEQEAYIAIKAKEKKGAEEEKKEALPKEERPDYKPFVPKEPAFGIFAEKLKTALDEKKKEKK